MTIPLSHVILLDGGIWWRRGSTWRWNHVDVYLFHADLTIDRIAYHALFCPNVLVFFVVIGTKHSVRDVRVIGVITLGAFPRMENEIGMFVLAGW